VRGMPKRFSSLLVEGWGESSHTPAYGFADDSANPAYLPICASGSRASTLHYVYVHPAHDAIILTCSCNDRLFPSTSLPRAPGDTSFRPAPIGRGCCGALPNGDHHQDEDTSSLSLHDSAFKPQVLLIDAGCEWMGYASDITRTIPVGKGGRYTEKAGAIYELVLRMQKVSSYSVWTVQN